MPRDPTPLAHAPNRIRDIRMAFEPRVTLEAIAEQCNTTRQTIARLETGEMELTVSWLVKVAKALRVPPAKLLPDGFSSTLIKVPIVGRIGDDERFIDAETAGQYLDDVAVPPELVECVGAVVDSSSLAPALHRGDIVFFDRGQPISPDEMLGEECIIHVGQATYLKRLQRGSAPGLYRLSSYRLPDIDDVSVEWVAPIEWIKRARGKR